MICLTIRFFHYAKYREQEYSPDSTIPCDYKRASVFTIGIRQKETVFPRIFHVVGQDFNFDIFVHK